MSNRDDQKVLRNIQIILSSKGLTPSQLREQIGGLINDELSTGSFVCDKAWQKCEVKVPTIYPLIHRERQQPIGSCAVHGGVFVQPEPTTTVA